MEQYYLKDLQPLVVSNSNFNKMIILVGIGWFQHSPGGQERYIYEFVNNLVAKKEDQLELYTVDISDMTPNAHLKLINLCESNEPVWKRIWLSYRNFSRRTRTEPDAINLHFALYSLPLLLSFSKNTPITFTFHGPWSYESKQEGDSKLSQYLKFWMEQIVYQQCDRFIVLSKAFGSILNETYRIPWDKIHIIPGGVDTSRFQPNLNRKDARSQLNWPQDRPILFTPRRLVHRMGLDKLIAALVETQKQVPEIWLAIAGKGPLRETLEQQVQDLNLGKHVKFLGYLPDENLPVAYQAADLTIMPSQNLEGFGLVLLESLACGTPALCTPVGGMPEVIAPFYGELVTQTTDKEAIAERLIDFLTGRLELPSREACREYAVKNFDWTTIAPRVREVLLIPKKS